MTTFRVNARHPRGVEKPARVRKAPAKPDMRLQKIKLWASDPAWRPARKIVLPGTVSVDALTYARAIILKDVGGLSVGDFLSRAVEQYCDLIARQQGIEHDDPSIAAWINGDETESKD